MSDEKSSKTEKKVAYRESSLHINYLYQLATSTLAQTPENTDLVKFYLQTMQSIAKKLVLRLDPSIKRTLCKKCFMLLVPGITATVRIRSKNRRKKHTVVQCLECKTLKRFNTNSEYRLWTEQTEAWAPKKNTESDKRDKGETSSAIENKKKGDKSKTSVVCTDGIHMTEAGTSAVPTQDANSSCDMLDSKENYSNGENGEKDKKMDLNYSNGEKAKKTEHSPVDGDKHLLLGRDKEMSSNINKEESPSSSKVSSGDQGCMDTG